ncbi:DUF6513 domain-containing protein [Neorhodopirellula lusitana]|uniref:DUF6513 domain-containing protein n=1 Tax=Neorhodopirellula lusitana TaxID=445327 RepID=UPI00384A7824
MASSAPDSESQTAPAITPQTHLHFVTGRLAEVALRTQVEQASRRDGFSYSVQVMPITVAALITPKWLLRHLEVPAGVSHVVLPGYCQSSIEDPSGSGSDVVSWRTRIARAANLSSDKILCGPNDCRDIGAWLSGRTSKPDLTKHSIEIIAEINHAPRMSIEDVVKLAERLRDDGADRIDLGCDPARRCEAIGDYTAALVQYGHRVSIDTFDSWEVEKAVGAGASLVLSVNASNRNLAADWGCEVVAIPDVPDDLKSLDETVALLERNQVPMRLDPILEPIGFGFGSSLLRYTEVRRRYPEHAMMMGIGNLTELTDVDSAGVNMVLLALCEEFSIHSVLTTQVINWASSSVKECEVARRLVHHSLAEGVPPKRLSEELVMLRDPKLRPFAAEAIEALAAGVRDNNYRIIAQDGVIHLISAGVHLQGNDPFAILEELLRLPQSDNVDASHAFYLGYEMAKAATAMQLGKQYDQDQALKWGHLTQPEGLHRLARKSRHGNEGQARKQKK